jgi:anti-repressor protein
MSELNQLFPVTPASFFEPSVDARSLHGWLGVESKFADWMPRVISGANLSQDLDFSIILNPENNPNGRPSKEYLLTVCSPHLRG